MNLSARRQALGARISQRFMGSRGNAASKEMLFLFGRYVLFGEIDGAMLSQVQVCEGFE